MRSFPRFRTFALAVGACLSIVISVEGAISTERQQVPGTSVTLVPPEGYLPGDSFAGFMNTDTGASVIIISVPGPISKVARGFQDPRALKQQGMQLVGSEPHKNGDLDGVLVRAKQAVEAQDFDKWMWVFGDTEESILVMGTWPAELSSLDAELRAAVLSARISDAPTAPMAGLGFEVTPAAPLTFWSRSGNNLLYLNEEAKVPITDGDAIFTVGPATRPVEFDDVETFARQRLKGTAQYKRFEVETAKRISLDGLGGVVLVAKAISSTGGEAFIHQTVLIEGATYWLAQGIAPLSQRETYLPVFRATIESFRRERRILKSRDKQLRITLPHGWYERDSADPEVLELHHASADCAMSVLAEGRRELGDDITLEEYGDLTLESLFAGDDIEVVSQRALKINGLNALQREVHTTIDGLALTYLHTVLENEENFIQIAAWTSTAAYEVDPDYLESLVGTLEVGG
jgi:hypothetical protein